MLDKLRERNYSGVEKNKKERIMTFKKRSLLIKLG